MTYTNSPLVVYTKLSPNYNKRSSAPAYGYKECIKNIAIHHMAGALSLQACGNVFYTGKGSSNYGVDNEGKVGMYVEEKNRAWTTSTRRDFESITIEVANTPESTKDKTWKVSDAAIRGLINLCVDICQRNGIKALVWSDDKNIRKSGANGCNMYVHRDYDNTYCPGDYLLSKLPYVAEQVNMILMGQPAPTPVVTKPTVPSPSLYKNNTGARVKDLQKCLTFLGYSVGGYGCDGIYGNATLNAVKAFQKNVFPGQPKEQDGIYGPKTAAKLKEAVAKA